MNIVLWILQGILALMFAAAGFTKVSQPKEKLQTAMAWVEDFSPGFPFAPSGFVLEAGDKQADRAPDGWPRQSSTSGASGGRWPACQDAPPALYPSADSASFARTASTTVWCSGKPPSRYIECTRSPPTDTSNEP